MATDYSPDRLAAMTDELLDAAQRLGVPLAPTRPAHGVPADDEGFCGEGAAARDLITALLAATARWSETSGSRATGPFGAYLAGLAAGNAEAVAGRPAETVARTVADSDTQPRASTAHSFGLLAVDELLDPPAENAATEGAASRERALSSGAA